jgi:hypothetical protein
MATIYFIWPSSTAGRKRKKKERKAENPNRIKMEKENT